MGLLLRIGILTEPVTGGEALPQLVGLRKHRLTCTPLFVTKRPGRLARTLPEPAVRAWLVGTGVGESRSLMPGLWPSPVPSDAQGKCPPMSTDRATEAGQSSHISAISAVAIGSNNSR